MNKLEVDMFNPFHAGIKVIKSLKMHYKQNLKSRIQTESSYWVDPQENFLEELKKNNDDYEAYHT